MKEPRSNVGYMHTACAITRKEKWQQKNKDLVLKPGNFVKLPFFDHAGGP